MSLLDSAVEVEENPFKLYEQKLLLLALTYRICSMYNRKLVNDGEEAGGRKNEIFIRLIQLIEKYYMQERGVEFYADKLCLSPKYLSAVSKSICGYTVQELVFKAIIRKKYLVAEEYSAGHSGNLECFRLPQCFLFRYIL